ncbi:MAG: hypothetical protein OXT09_31160 [Myxococcales bacterium]|nr:hypothetical protein [Myxococcales bacterium]
MSSSLGGCTRLFLALGLLGGRTRGCPLRFLGCFALDAQALLLGRRRLAGGLRFRSLARSFRFGRPARSFRFGRPARSFLFGRPARSFLFGRPARGFLFCRLARGFRFCRLARGFRLCRCARGLVRGRPAGGFRGGHAGRLALPGEGRRCQVRQPNADHGLATARAQGRSRLLGGRLAHAGAPPVLVFALQVLEEGLLELPGNRITRVGDRRDPHEGVAIAPGGRVGPTQRDATGIDRGALGAMLDVGRPALEQALAVLGLRHPALEQGHRLVVARRQVQCALGPLRAVRSLAHIGQRVVKVRGLHRISLACAKRVEVGQLTDRLDRRRGVERSLVGLDRPVQIALALDAQLTEHAIDIRSRALTTGCLLQCIGLHGQHRIEAVVLAARAQQAIEPGERVQVAGADLQGEGHELRSALGLLELALGDARGVQQRASGQLGRGAFGPDLQQLADVGQGGQVLGRVQERPLPGQQVLHDAEGVLVSPVSLEGFQELECFRIHTDIPNANPHLNLQPPIRGWQSSHRWGDLCRSRVSREPVHGPMAGTRRLLRSADGVNEMSENTKEKRSFGHFPRG